jgi:hypothetical protein
MKPHSMTDLHQSSEKLNIIKEAACFSETLAQTHHTAFENITGNVLSYLYEYVCLNF